MKVGNCGVLSVDYWCRGGLLSSSIENTNGDRIKVLLWFKLRILSFYALPYVEAEGCEMVELFYGIWDPSTSFIINTIAFIEEKDIYICVVVKGC